MIKIYRRIYHMKKQIEQAVKEIMAQYNRIDQVYINRRLENEQSPSGSIRNVENKRYDDDNWDRRKKTYGRRS